MPKNIFKGKISFKKVRVIQYAITIIDRLFCLVKTIIEPYFKYILIAVNNFGTALSF